LKAGASKTIKVMMVNDHTEEANGKLVLSLETEAGQEIARTETAFSMPASGSASYELTLAVPKESGKCLLKAAAIRPGNPGDAPTLSRRKVEVAAAEAK
jgi:hypothetical protein